MSITRLLIALNVLVYVAMGLHSGSWITFDGRTEVLFGADYAPLVLRGEWFRLLTCVFLHGGILHIGMNMIALNQVGVMLEPFYGRLRFVSIYLASGICASLASLLLHKVPTLSVGASGAIAGLIGAGVVAGQVVGTDQGKRFRDGMLRWAGTIVVFGFMVPGIDNASHAGGFVAGILAAAAISPTLRRHLRGGTPRVESALELPAASAILLVAVAAAFFFAYRSAQLLLSS